jgi:hypothetical protein
LIQFEWSWIDFPNLPTSYPSTPTTKFKSMQRST